MDRIICLHAKRIEVSVFADVVRRRVGKENELRSVICPRRVAKATVSVEQTEKQLRCSADICRVSASGVFGAGELVPPPKVYEAVDVALVVVLLRVSGCVERVLELRRLKVCLEVEFVV